MSMCLQVLQLHCDDYCSPVCGDGLLVESELVRIYCNDFTSSTRIHNRCCFSTARSPSTCRPCNPTEVGRASKIAN